MNKIKPLVAILLSFILLFLSACKGIGEIGSELKVGVEGITGQFNPFYAESDADREIVTQMFRSVQIKNSHNKLVNHSGGISYELVGENQVKYTVSIKEDMKFSDGTNITIDDVIFFYHFISDATYDGTYKDWYLNDIVGLKEYYFDDRNYQSSIANIEEKVEKNYTLTTIEPEDYAEYLVATNLEGKFSGNLDSMAPSGVSWEKYILSLGYKEALEDLGETPSDESVLKLAATVEAENNPLAYNPESWYRERLYTKYINDNYSDGADVESIEGIKKVNDYTCTILFNSRNINAVSEINALLVSKAFYAAEYIKGDADKVKAVEENPISSGPYVFVDYRNDEVSLTANSFYEDADCEFSSIKFIDLAAKEDDPVKSVLSGKVDVVTTLATSDIADSLNEKNVQYFISDCDYYVSLFFNTRSLDSSVRKALMGLCSLNNTVEQKIGSYYTRLFRPISVRFAEYPSSVTEPYYNESAFTVYSMANDSKVTAVSAYYSGTENDLEYSVLTSYRDILAEKGISLNIVLTDEQTLENAIASGLADMWIENVSDGDTCDKYEYFNSRGLLNKTAVNNPEIDSMTAGIRSAVGFSDKAQMTSQLMTLVMEQAVEYPLYQLQNITIYNTETINPDSFEEGVAFDGFSYYLSKLKRN